MSALLFEDKIPESERAQATAMVRNVSSLLKLPGNDVGANWIMGVMNSESGLDPSIQNSIDATGLIQFLPSTAESLGTTVDALKNMSYTDQLNYVYLYFKPLASKLKSYKDLYVATFYPAALGEPSTYVFPDFVYQANPGLDLNGDGKITMQDFENFTLKYIPQDWLSIFESYLPGGSSVLGKILLFMVITLFLVFIYKSFS